ncbi:hypothetical protein HAX54_004896 [Datura stramonium]|uniref:Secreted protein n=1 Tax=Datura stramonium TaxID=4076 RepID=A0ABS8WWT9_DATST|nr:hypothetical protein [Datura stramonium]
MRGPLRDICYALLLSLVRIKCRVAACFCLLLLLQVRRVVHHTSLGPHRAWHYAEGLEPRAFGRTAVLALALLVAQVQPKLVAYGNWKIMGLHGHYCSYRTIKSKAGFTCPEVTDRGTSTIQVLSIESGYIFSL